MGKKSQNTNISDEPVRTDLNFGEIDTGLEAKLTDVDPLQSIPSFVPGKPGFEEGDRLAGYYVGTKRVYSEKFTAGKREEGTGKLYRDLHILRHEKHGKFGIWSVGALNWVMPKIEPGKFIVVTYTGLGEKPLKPGQNAPHTFRFQGDNLDLDTNTLGAMDYEEMGAAPAPRQTDRDAARV